jgi:hypothetical protein
MPSKQFKERQWLTINSRERLKFYVVDASLSKLAL